MHMISRSLAKIVLATGVGAAVAECATNAQTRALVGDAGNRWVLLRMEDENVRGAFGSFRIVGG
jgi:hypothetical protein